MAIDWDYWLKLHKLLNEEIILLTLGLNPDEVKIDYFMGERYIPNKENLLGELNLEYDRRMRLLTDSRLRPFTYLENLNDGDWGNYFSADENGTQVITTRFLLWLKNEDFGWDLPKELEAYIEKLDMPNQEHWAQGLVDNLNNRHSQSEPAKVKLSWTLKPLSKIQRMNGYRAVLYQTLQKMYNEGKLAPPTPHEVLNSWRVEFKDQPNDCKIYVLSKSFEYFSEMGTKKTVDIKSLKDAIKRLIITE